jgi:hypothetical protein
MVLRVKLIMILYTPSDIPSKSLTAEAISFSCMIARTLTLLATPFRS